jgi:threonine/homoserine/homoserine lactone efflux protein
MPSGAAMSLFLVAAFILLITPGPAVTYIVARSLSQGRTAGLVSSLGVGLGGLLHVTAAALGLSAIVASSALAFSALKYAGAAYLIWLGLQRIFGGSTEATETAPARESLRRIFWQGAVVNALNPKAALFFLAFLPQFVNPQGSLVPQILLLGMIFVTMAIVTDSTWALIASTAAIWLRGRAGLARSGRYLAGSTYITLGLATAFSGSRHD